MLSVAFAVLSALGFGVANVALAYGSVQGISTTLVVNMLVVLGIYVIGFSTWVHIRLRGAAARMHAGQTVSPVLLPTPIRPRDWLGMAAIGLLGYGAQLSFALASLDGALSVVAVLASLYPVVTVLLGWRLLGERLLRIQIIGVVFVFLGVATIAATA
jgi:drug/metabolite transporter (DMT)-like permease